MRAGMDQAAPKIAKALWEKGNFVLSTPPARIRTPPNAYLRSESTGIETEPFPPRGTISHQHITTPPRSPVAESRLWEPLNHRLESLPLTFDRYLAAPPSYTDAIAQQPPTGRGQERDEQRRRPAYHQLAPQSLPNSDDGTVSTEGPLKLQSNTMRLWNNQESRRQEKVKISVTATLMSSNKYSISIECNGRYIDGGLVGKNVSIETSLSRDITDLVRSGQ
ncbi:hypothetical protein PMIN06_008824 [Paraphaeosphaeria minitans]|uniref:Uncharacterized protein n=1 Tax=Paraphaeosphaeria minitans TaxID=565426 RepID=A0A9P6GSB7_9PLEO|nr:hypothetical protein PMIN01_00511 [Paraphaeosphaeria minitans]